MIVRGVWSGMVSILLIAVSFLFFSEQAQAYEDEYSRPENAGDFFYLGFSFGEGTYISYECPDCDRVTLAPAEFEVLFGIKLTPWLSLDLAGTWSIDFSYYDRVTYLAGLRPGVRILFPRIFHRVLYLRAAIPIMFGLTDINERIVVGVMAGLGLEWQWGPAGLFVEFDVEPYFVEVHDDYYVVPTMLRLGGSFRF